MLTAHWKSVRDKRTSDLGPAVRFIPGNQNVRPAKLEKREHGRIQGLPNFFKVHPIISGMGKAMNCKFCTHIHTIDQNKSPLKILEK